MQLQFAASDARRHDVHFADPSGHRLHGLERSQVGVPSAGISGEPHNYVVYNLPIWSYSFVSLVSLVHSCVCHNDGGVSTTKHRAFSTQSKPTRSAGEERAIGGGDASE